MESQFRQLGVNLKLDKGKFVILSDFVVCETGSALTPEQAMMVKHLGIQMDEFRFDFLAYVKKGGEYKMLEQTDLVI